MARMLESPTKGGGGAPGVGVPTMQRAASAAPAAAEPGRSATGGVAGPSGAGAADGMGGFQRQQPNSQQQPLPPAARDRFILNFDSLVSIVVWKVRFEQRDAYQVLRSTAHRFPELCNNKFKRRPAWCSAQAQFMDDQHLLLALGPPDASALRHTESQQQAAFLAVYSLQVKAALHAPCPVM